MVSIVKRLTILIMIKPYHYKDHLMVAKQPYIKWFKTIEDAKLYCSLLVIDGFDDWRLPNGADSKTIHKMANKLNVNVNYHYNSDIHAKWPQKAIPVRNR